MGEIFINIRMVELSEVGLLASIARKTYSETFEKENTVENMTSYLDQSFNIAQVKKELMNPDSVFYFVEFEGKIIGYLKLNFAAAQTELQTDDTLEIERIYVLAAYQGKGIGNRLMEKAISIARSTKVNVVWLGVWEKNTKAIQFYKKKGFVKFDQHDFWMGEEQQTDWMMKREVS